MKSEQEIWTDCLAYLEKRIKKQSFYTWLRPTRAERLMNDKLVVSVPNRFVVEWLEEHYLPLIHEALLAVTGKSLAVILQIGANGGGAQLSESNGQVRSFADQRTAAQEPVHGESRSANSSASFHPKTIDPRVVKGAAPGDGQLNLRYTFDTFVVGESNQFAHAAALAVAESASGGAGQTKYNPLFVYGGTGLGKTHLAQAIGHYVKELTPQARILYVTSEKFTSDFITAIGHNTANAFAAFYRQAELLIIDDIQFFTGKESTQMQFFHTFNALYHNGKQIVLTADRAPKEIRGLEDRLLSRFSWGLVTDIQPPDMETRLAILKKRTAVEQIGLPEDVLEFVALRVTSNIRELEGALVRLLAYASLARKDITLEVAQTVLKDTLSNGSAPSVTIEQIKQEVAQEFGVPLEVLVAKRKTQEVALARQVAMYLARTLTSSSLKTVGEKFGGRDHSTVLHACNVVAEQLKSNIDFKRRIDGVITSLYV